MCGIAGFIDHSMSTTKKELEAMTGVLSHRGPDGFGHSIWNVENALIGFGHRRLSIIDLSSAADQPMSRENLSIVFNGEIYNYREVRSELRKLGYSFISQSDTEVVLFAFKEWGQECVHKFRGMFAFSIYDHKKAKIYFFKDRIGVKPLFLYENNGLILFASELKSFHEHPRFTKEVNINAVNLYFKYGFVPSPLCIFNKVKKVKPGHIIIYDLKTQKSESVEYWNASSFVKQNHQLMPTGQELEDEIEGLLQESFEYRMVADVPVGVFLSGGYDSSLVTAMLQHKRTTKINTFTIGFENKSYNEANHAQEVANYLGTSHNSYICTQREAQNIIPDLPYYYDEPFADSSAIPTFLVSKVTSSSVKVALSADGGDELFSGYNRNLRFLNIHNKAQSIPKVCRKLGGNVAGLLTKVYFGNLDKGVWWSKAQSILNDPSLLNIIDIYPQFLSKRYISSLLVNGNIEERNPQLDIRRQLGNNPDKFNALLSYDYQSTLTNDMLVKVDRASMANSLEGREPMLDHKLYEYMAKVPSSQKMQGGVLKYILKNITHKYIPKEIMERPKMGFGIPINTWLKTDLKYLVQENFQESRIKKHDILDPKTTRQMVLSLMDSNSNTNNQLWLLLSFQMWCEKWL